MVPQQCRPSEGRPPFDDVPTIQIFPGKLAFITSGQRISFQRCQPTIPPRIVQAGLARWLAVEVRQSIDCLLGSEQKEVPFQTWFRLQVFAESEHRSAVCLLGLVFEIGNLDGVAGLRVNVDLYRRTILLFSLAYHRDQHL